MESKNKNVALNRTISLVSIFFTVAVFVLTLVGTVSLELESGAHIANSVWDIFSTFGRTGRTNDLPLYVISYLIMVLPFVVHHIFLVIRIVSTCLIRESRDQEFNDLQGQGQLKKNVIETFIYSIGVSLTAALFGKVTVVGYLVYACFFISVIAQLVISILCHKKGAFAPSMNAIIFLSFWLMIFSITLTPSAFNIMYRGHAISNSYVDKNVYYPYGSSGEGMYSGLFATTITSAIMISTLLLITFLVSVKQLPNTQPRRKRFVLPLVFMIILTVIGVSLSIAKLATLTTKETYPLNPISPYHYVMSLLLFLFAGIAMIFTYIAKKAEK